MDTKDFWTLDQFKQKTLGHTKDFRTLDQFIQDFRTYKRNSL